MKFQLTRVMFILLSFATWRLSSLLTYEEGPFEIFTKLRSFLGVKWDKYSQPYGSNWFAKGVLCLWCNSVWFGLLLACSYSVITGAQWATTILLGLALSTAAIIIEGIVNRSE